MTFKEWFNLESKPKEGTISSAIYVHFIKSHESFLEEFWKESRKNTLEDVRNTLDKNRASTVSDIIKFVLDEELEKLNE